ncbi:hypothetical protein Tco_1237439, partial [Tanacetum coccineum]
ADYPTDRDDEEDETSGDENDDEDDEEEEEEHPAPADSVPPPPIHYTTARISIVAQALVPFLPKEETRASIAMMRTAASSTYTLAPPSGTPPLLPIPLPTLPPPFLLPSTDHRADRLEVSLPPRKRLCITLGPRYKVGESLSVPTTRPTGGFRADYGFVATLDDEIRRDPERDVGYGITDTWDEMLVGMPGRDRRSHAYTALLMERETRLSREAWGRSMDASDTARSEVRALRTNVLAQQMEIVIALQGQQGPASGPTQPEISEEAGSSS